MVLESCSDHSTAIEIALLSDEIDLEHCEEMQQRWVGRECPDGVLGRLWRSDRFAMQTFSATQQALTYHYAPNFTEVRVGICD